MAWITSAVYSKTGKTVKLRIKDGEELRTLTVSADILGDAPLSQATEICDNTLSILLENDELWRAELRALRLLEYSDSSRAELRRKLIARGFSAKAVDRAVMRMVELGYINEERRLRAIIASEANISLRGPRRIYAKLSAKGYSRELLSSVMNELSDSGEIDFKENAKKLLEKRGAGLSPEEKKRLLYTNGY